MGLFSKEEPKHLELRTGDRLSCRVCGFDRFFHRHGQLNTALATFFSLDWVNATAETSRREPRPNAIPTVGPVSPVRRSVSL